MSFFSVNSSYSSVSYPSSSAIGNKQANSAAKSSTQSDSVVEEFLSYQKLTPQQKIREAILKEYGLTEETLQQAPVNARKRIEEEIQEEIKKMVKNNMAQKGILIDITV